MNLLLTGVYGFICSNLCNLCHNKFNKIVGIDKVSYCSMPDNIKVDFEFIKGDICNFDLVYSILEKYQIDIIIHMAAQTHVDISFENSLEFTRDNIVGTHTLLEATRKYMKDYNFKKFVYMSTDEVYGSKEEIFLRYLRN